MRLSIFHAQRSAARRCALALPPRAKGAPRGAPRCTHGGPAAAAPLPCVLLRLLFLACSRASPRATIPSPRARASSRVERHVLLGVELLLVLALEQADELVDAILGAARAGAGGRKSARARGREARRLSANTVLVARPCVTQPAGAAGATSGATSERARSTGSSAHAQGAARRTPRLLTCIELHPASSVTICVPISPRSRLLPDAKVPQASSSRVLLQEFACARGVGCGAWNSTSCSCVAGVDAPHGVPGLRARKKQNSHERLRFRWASVCSASMAPTFENPFTRRRREQQREKEAIEAQRRQLAAQANIVSQFRAAAAGQANGGGAPVASPAGSAASAHTHTGSGQRPPKRQPTVLELLTQGQDQLQRLRGLPSSDLEAFPLLNVAQRIGTPHTLACMRCSSRRTAHQDLPWWRLHPQLNSCVSK